jgi:superfamily II DNA/RNA helicase
MHATSTSNARPHRNRRSGGGRSSGRPVTATAPVAKTSALDVALDQSMRNAPRQSVSFAEFELPAALVDTLAAAGITRPTPIQTMTMPDALAGRDVLGRAQTGSGKTLAFGLPMLTRLAAARTGQRSVHPRGLILLPTRELASQVEQALRPLAAQLSLRLLTVVGGESIGRQISELRRGVDVLIATPGRLLDLLERRATALDTVSVAVVDEADHMADLGFLPPVTRILDQTPTGRQCLLFSATLDRGVDRLVSRFLVRPAVHAVGDSAAATQAMTHEIFRLGREDKVAVASEIATRPARTLFFVRTKHGADRLARQLRNSGVDAAALHGNLNQNQRQRALAAFTSGATTVLVATDVAARGLHVDDLDLVVHFDLPADHKGYLHRSGRTARAGAQGTVISFVEPAQDNEVSKLHAGAGVRARSTTVRSGHPAVREIAKSGEPVVHTAPVARPSAGARPAPARPGHSSSRPARRRRR